jgi:hypothetical protein
MPEYASEFCYRCQSLRFDDQDFGGYAANGGYLKVSTDSNQVISSGPHATGIGDYTELNPGVSFEDDYPELPDLLSRAENCDFCRFLRRGVLSDDVRLSILDQCTDLDLAKESLRVKVIFGYSWEPERGVQSGRKVGLDALYVRLICIQPRRSRKYEIPVLAGVICELRYRISVGMSLLSRIQYIH